MGALDEAADLLGVGSPVSCYMYPEPDPGVEPGVDDVFAFQYWPASLTVNYEPVYAERNVLGGTHALQQWVCGKGRTISFEAIFTAELNTSVFNTPSIVTPSSRFTVNVAAAMNKLESYMRPSMPHSGVVKAPDRLILVLPKTALGGGARGSLGLTYDAIRVVLRSAPYTYEAWFPDGTPRVATVAMQFSETVQRKTSDGTAIIYKDRRTFANHGSTYKPAGSLPPRLASAQ